MSNYTSFLICFHPDHTDIYHNGLPLGVIRDGVFRIHENTMPDGTKVPVKIPENLLFDVANVRAAIYLSQTPKT
jgi:hypothetical protein